MSRELMRKHIDRYFFRRTASSAKAINLGVMSMRGGIRF